MLRKMYKILHFIFVKCQNNCKKYFINTFYTVYKMN